MAPVAQDTLVRFRGHINHAGPVSLDRPELGPCYLWTGAVNDKGYGVFSRKVDGRWVTTSAHRYACELVDGHPVPDELEPDHLCRVRLCVRRSHLELVSHAVNVARGETGSNSREKTHCPAGHEYDEANTYRNRGRRQCRACKLAWQSAHRVPAMAGG